MRLKSRASFWECLHLWTMLLCARPSSQPLTSKPTCLSRHRTNRMAISGREAATINIRTASEPGRPSAEAKRPRLCQSLIRRVAIVCRGNLGREWGRCFHWASARPAGVRCPGEDRQMTHCWFWRVGNERRGLRRLRRMTLCLRDDTLSVSSMCARVRCVRVRARVCGVYVYVLTYVLHHRSGFFCR